MKAIWDEIMPEHRHISESTLASNSRRFSKELHNDGVRDQNVNFTWNTDHKIKLVELAQEARAGGRGYMNRMWCSWVEEYPELRWMTKQLLRDSASRFEKETEVQQVLHTHRRNKEENTSELTRFFDEMFGESFSEDYVFEGFDTDEYINNEVETSRLEADRQQTQGSSYVEDDVNTVNLEEIDEQLQLLNKELLTNIY